ncbi:MAG: hypothetical protein DRQ10_04220 [Candidatus Hydrothermota bacterium]|nr:MAG: hypothetical protein DRQ10_04220 [Candidatus Hydrothermae bacterium]
MSYAEKAGIIIHARHRHFRIGLIFLAFSTHGIWNREWHGNGWKSRHRQLGLGIFGTDFTHKRRFPLYMARHAGLGIGNGIEIKQDRTSA